MSNTLDLVGRIAGILGLLVCAVSGALRLFGNYHLADIELATLFLVGAGLLIAGCFLKLEAASARKQY